MEPRSAPLASACLIIVMSCRCAGSANGQVLDHPFKQNRGINSRVYAPFAKGFTRPTILVLASHATGALRVISREGCQAFPCKLRCGLLLHG